MRGFFYSGSYHLFWRCDITIILNGATAELELPALITFFGVGGSKYTFGNIVAMVIIAHHQNMII